MNFPYANRSHNSLTHRSVAAIGRPSTLNAAAQSMISLRDTVSGNTLANLVGTSDHPPSSTRPLVSGPVMLETKWGLPFRGGRHDKKYDKADEKERGFLAIPRIDRTRKFSVRVQSVKGQRNINELISAFPDLSAPDKKAHMKKSYKSFAGMDVRTTVSGSSLRKLTHRYKERVRNASLVGADTYPADAVQLFHFIEGGNAQQTAETLLFAHRNIVGRAGEVTDQPVISSQFAWDVVQQAVSVLEREQFTIDDLRTGVRNVRDFVAEMLRSQGGRDRITFLQLLGESPLANQGLLPQSEKMAGTQLGFARAGFEYFNKSMIKYDETFKKNALRVADASGGLVGGGGMAGAFLSGTATVVTHAIVDETLKVRNYQQDLDNGRDDQLYRELTGAATPSDIRDKWTQLICMLSHETPSKA